MSALIRSFGFAFNGLRRCINSERNFKIHSVMTILVILAGLFFKVRLQEWLALSICIGSVLSAELINTAIEELCNVVEKERHDGIMLVKDFSAAAVLISSIGAAVIGLIIFIPKFFYLLK